MDNVEIDFEGTLPDSIKRDIDCLVDGGFDPERTLENNRKNFLQQEQQANLLLPQSCMPTIGEMSVAPGQYGEEVSIADIEAYLEKLILDLPPSSTFLLDFRGRNYLIGAEIVLSRLSQHMKGNYIRYVITPEMKDAVQKAQKDSWEARARYN